MEQKQQNKKIMFSGIQPSGDITLGNYLGAIKNWVELQDDYINYYCIVDMHAITVRQNPPDLRRRSFEQLAIYIAAGLDPQKNIMFIQSHVPAHAELSWVLGCYTMFGELSRMTQFKEKSTSHAENVNGGLFTYPVLMAADILLYNADFVPVGADQKQHVELARNIAERFNAVHGETLKIPEPYIPQMSAKIYSLQDPTKKMSKSDMGNESSYVLLLDKKDTVIKKFKKAVTDSGSEVRYGEGKDGINNLIAIYSLVTGKTYPAIEKEFDGKGYGAFKNAVGEAVADMLTALQDKYNVLMSDKAQLESILKENRDKAAYAASKILSKVYKKVGFYQLGK